MRRVAAFICALLLGCSLGWGEPVETRAIEIKHAPVPSLLALCRRLYPGVHCEPGHKAIVATGNKRVVAAVEAFIETVDLKPRKVLLEIRTVSLTDDEVKLLGFTVGASVSGRCFPPDTWDFEEVVPSKPTILHRFPVVLQKRTAQAVLVERGHDHNHLDVVTRSFSTARAIVGERISTAYYEPNTGNLELRLLDTRTTLLLRPILTNDGCVSLRITRDLITPTLGRNTSSTASETVVRLGPADAALAACLPGARDVADTTPEEILKGPTLGDFVGWPGRRMEKVVTISVRVLP